MIQVAGSERRHRKDCLPLEQITFGDRLEVTKTGEFATAIRVFDNKIVVETARRDRIVIGLNQVTYSPPIELVYERALFYRGKCPDGSPEEGPEG